MPIYADDLAWVKHFSRLIEARQNQKAQFEQKYRDKRSSNSSKGKINIPLRQKDLREAVG